MVMIPIRAGWRDKVAKEPEWRGPLPCASGCPITTDGIDTIYTYHVGFAAKRQATLYGLPVAPLGRSSIGYIACEMCGKGGWWKGDEYQVLSRQAAAFAATFDAVEPAYTPPGYRGKVTQHQAKWAMYQPFESLVQELSRCTRPSNKLDASLTYATDWRGNRVFVRFGDVLRYPNNFLLAESHAREIAQSVGLQQKLEQERRRERQCRQCGGDVGEDEVGCACGPWTDEKNRVVNYYMTAFGDTRDEAEARYERPPDPSQEGLVH